MDSEKNFAEDLLHKIKDEKIQPKPKWQFLLKNYVIWGTGTLALLLGAISMSLIFYMNRNNDLAVYDRAGGEFWEKLLILIPLFWIICLVIFILAVFYNIKHTKKGYRYSPWLVLSAIIFTSVVLGGIFDSADFGEKIDDVLGQNAPFYDRLINPRINFWSRPEQGRLMGLIISQVSSDVYLLTDREKIEWKVLTGQAKQLPGVVINIGKPARFIGRIQAAGEFEATEVLSIMPGQGFFKKPSLMGRGFSGFDRLKADCQGGFQQFKPGPDNFSQFLEKYPEIKAGFEKSLLDNKSQIKNIINSDQTFINNLELLKINQETIKQLQK